MSDPLTIALMIETGGPGGAEHMLLHLADALARRGHEVVPVIPSDRGPWLREQFRAHGFTPEHYDHGTAFDPRCARQVMAVLRKRRVQVVHSHEFSMAVYGGLATWMLRRPHLITMHGGRYYTERWQRRAVMRLAVRASRAVIGVSNATARELEETLKLPPGRVRMIHNGIAFKAGSGAGVRTELGIAPGELLVVCVGNLYPVKGHVVLLRAMARLASQPGLPRWHVAIAGRGGEEEPLRAFAAAHGLADRVHLLGFRSDVSDVLAAADVYAMPSLSEGLPLSVLEAMHAAKPIVASDVGGIPEAVRANETALLVPPGDDAALASALVRLLSSAELRARLAEAAQHDVERRFGVERMADSYEALYRSALGGGDLAS